MKIRRHILLCRATARGRYTRRAGTLICVMVVLLIVGTLAAQTLQLATIISRKNSQQRMLRQAREVLELARAMPSRLDVGEPVSIDLTDESDGDQLQALIKFIKPSTESSPDAAETRIVVRYPADSPREVTVTWEAEK